MQLNPDLVTLINESFIPVAYNTYDLFSLNSPTNAWFQKYAPAASFNLAATTRLKTWQGFYMLGADGSPYGYWHNGKADKPVLDPFQPDILAAQLAEFRGAIARFRQKPPQAIALTSAASEPPSTYRADDSVSVIRVFTRLPCEARNPQMANVGRDILWIYPEDVREVLKTSDDTGGSFSMPDHLRMRILRFHLKDFSIHNEMQWQREHIRQGVVNVVELPRMGNQRQFRFNGAFAMAQSYVLPWGVRSNVRFQGNLTGEFGVDPATSKIVRWRLYAEGPYYGQGSLQDPKQQRDFTLVVAMADANADTEARNLAPVGYAWNFPHNMRGKAYDAKREYRFAAGGTSGAETLGTPRPTASPQAAASSPMAAPVVAPPKGALPTVGERNLTRPFTDLAGWRLLEVGGGKAIRAVEGGGIRLDVTAFDDVDWHVALHQGGLPLEDGKQYRGRVEAPPHPARPKRNGTAGVAVRRGLRGARRPGMAHHLRNGGGGSSSRHRAPADGNFNHRVAND